MEENVDIIKKVLDHLVFNPYGIKYDMYTDDVEGEFTLSFDVYVDIDRYFKFGSRYDKNYSNRIDDIEKNIFNSLRYVNMQGYFTSLQYLFINQEVLHRKIDELNEILRVRLIEDYGVTQKEFEKAEIYYNPVITEGENPYIVIYFYGDEIFFPNGNKKISCRELTELMYIIYDKYFDSSLFLSTTNYICA